MKILLQKKTMFQLNCSWRGNFEIVEKRATTNFNYVSLNHFSFFPLIWLSSFGYYL